MENKARLSSRQRIVIISASAVAVALIAVAVVVQVRLATVGGSDTTRLAALVSSVGTSTIALPADAASAKRDVIDRMTIHHTESGATVGGKAVDAAMIGQWHVARDLNDHFQGAAAAAYHFIILPDGTVQAGRPLDIRGSGTRNMDDNRRSIGVALVGDFSSVSNHGQDVPGRPTAAQLRALNGLALWAFSTFGFGPADVHGHREKSTSDCPGDRFDMDSLRTSLAAAQVRGERGIRPPIVVTR